MPFENISVFGQSSWLGAGQTKINEQDDGIAGGHSVIKITPNYAFYKKSRNDLKPVVGVTLNRVQVNVESTWQPMGVPKVPLIQSIGNFANSVSDFTSLAGGGELGSVWMSKQLWRKNGYLDISPEFRVVDWDGSGKPIRFATALAKMAMPGKSDTSLSKSVEDLSNDFENLLENYANELADLTKNNKEWLANKKQYGYVKAAYLINDTVGQVAEKLVNANRNILEDIHDVITLKNAPPPVRVQIGQYFYHPDMVIKSINFNFSQEQSDLGPLYVDITVGLQTRKIMSGIDDIGFTNVKKLKSRIDVVNATTQQ